MVVSFHPIRSSSCRGLYCAVPRVSVSVSVHPARRSAPRITRDAGHHSRCVQVALLLAGVARASWHRASCLWAHRTRGPLTQGPRGVLRTRLVDPLSGDQPALHWSSRCSADADAGHGRAAQGAQGPWRSKARPSIRRVTSLVTARSTAVRKAAMRGSSVVTVSTASSDDAARLAGIEARRTATHADIGVSLEGLRNATFAEHCVEVVRVLLVAASKARGESSNHPLRIHRRDVDAAAARGVKSSKGR